MHFTVEAKSTLRYLLSLDVPEGAFLDVDSNGDVNAQCATQAGVRELRVAFGAGVVWTKAYSEECKWWMYDTTLPNGIAVHIYAVTEAPPTCKAIVEEIEVEERMPVEWVTKMVKKEWVRWDCSGAPDEARDAGGEV